MKGDALRAQERGNGAERVDVAVVERKRDAVPVCGGKRNDGNVVFVCQLLNGFYLLRKLRVRRSQRGLLVLQMWIPEDLPYMLL